MEIKITKKRLKMDDFINKYQDDKFIEFCKVCKNYSKNWACPELSFDHIKYLEEYKNIELHLLKIIFSEDEIEKSIGQDIYEYGNMITKDIKNNYCKELISKEKIYTKVINSGGCSFCNICSRVYNKKCIKPNLLRYSMDSFGINLTKISQDVFNENLKWEKDRLPENYNLIFGICEK